jgi:hypothetical protein
MGAKLHSTARALTVAAVVVALLGMSAWLAYAMTTPAGIAAYPGTTTTVSTTISRATTSVPITTTVPHASTTAAGTTPTTRFLLAEAFEAGASPRLASQFESGTAPTTASGSATHGIAQFAFTGAPAGVLVLVGACLVCAGVLFNIRRRRRQIP